MRCRRTTRGASPHRDLGSFAVDAVSTTVGVAKATAENLAPKVGGVIDQLGVVPAAAAAASSHRIAPRAGDRRTPGYFLFESAGKL